MTMDNVKPNETAADRGDSANLNAKLAEDTHLGNPSNAKTLETTSATTVSGADKFLPSFDQDNSFATWQSGESKRSQTASDESGTAHSNNFSENNWTARYAANFDQPGDAANPAQHLDMAPILGLPQGTSHEELIKVAGQQEDELLKQLFA